MHLGRQVVEQKGEGLVNRWGIDQVVIVQDEDKIVRDGGDFIEQGRQQRFSWRRLRGLEHAQHPCAKFRHYPFAFAQDKRLQCRDEVSQKAVGVAIAFVQRQPGDRSRRAPAGHGEPFADQGGFPKAGRGGDQRQFAVQPRVQPLEQADAGHNLGARWGEKEFSG